MYAEPILQVVRGDPTAEELAALVCVLAGARTGRPAAGPRSAPLPGQWGVRRPWLAPVPGS